MVDYLCGKFVDCSFSRFGFIVRFCVIDSDFCNSAFLNKTFAFLVSCLHSYTLKLAFVVSPENGTL